MVLPRFFSALHEHLGTTLLIKITAPKAAQPTKYSIWRFSMRNRQDLLTCREESQRVLEEVRGWLRETAIYREAHSSRTNKRESQTWLRDGERQTGERSQENGCILLLQLTRARILRRSRLGCPNYHSTTHTRRSNNKCRACLEVPNRIEQPSTL